MKAKALFFAAISLGCISMQADSAGNKPAPLRLVDVDGNAHSTADGHITVLVQTTNANLAKAEMIGDRTPDFCLGNPHYRMITVIELGNEIAPVRSVMTAMVRNRLDNASKSLQARYDALKIEKVARHDMFAVADFDGSAVAQLDHEPGAFRIFVFGRNGELLKQWDDVPSAAELATVLK